MFANNYEPEFINRAYNTCVVMVDALETLAQGETYSESDYDSSFDSVYDYVKYMEVESIKLLNAGNDAFLGVLVDCGSVEDTHIYIDTYECCVKVAGVCSQSLSYDACCEIDAIYH